jgi:DNA-binding NarL/FixJ family response regulator
VVAGEVAMDPEVIGRVMRRKRVVDPLDRLTPGERQVLALMAEGRSNAGIAGILNYGVKTVEKRITAIADKLGLRDVGETRGMNLRVLAVLTYLSRDGSG